MSPYHTKNRGRHYSYYASNPGDGSREQALRLPGGELDAALRNALVHLLSDSTSLRRHYLDLQPTQLLDHCAGLSDPLCTLTVAEVRLLLDQLRSRVVVRRDQLDASISSQALLSLAEI